MAYFISFLEGVITFVSPCMLPMLPIYVSYFAGQNQDGERHKTLLNAIGFVIGFTVIFVLLGAFAGSFGRFLREYSTSVNILFGIIMILFGLNFMQIIYLPLINNSKQFSIKNAELGFISSLLFGIIFSVGWTPCIGTFLGSALMLAATQGENIRGILMLFCFCLGLGIPFILSAVLIDNLKSTFDFIKKNYRTINAVAGSFLVFIGILTAAGKIEYFLSLLSF